MKQPPTRGWLNMKMEIPPTQLPSIRVVFLCSYLQNVKTNVSNAKRDRPKIKYPICYNWLVRKIPED